MVDGFTTGAAGIGKRRPGPRITAPASILGHAAHGIPALMENLQGFTQSTLEQLRLKGPTLPDVPTEPWPDKWVLQESKSVTADGRTAAVQYCRRSAFRTHADGESQYYSMPPTLATVHLEPQRSGRERPTQMSTLLASCLRSTCWHWCPPETASPCTLPWRRCARVHPT